MAKPNTHFLPSACFFLIRSAISCATLIEAVTEFEKTMLWIFSKRVSSTEPAG